MADEFFQQLAAAEKELLDVVWPEGRNPAAPRDGHHFALPAHHRRPVSISRTESRFLANLIALLDASRILEIGTGFGYSTTWLARGLSLCSAPDTVYTVDNWTEGNLCGLGREVASQLWSRTHLTSLITSITGGSPDAVRALAPGAVDLVFIDGDHLGDQPVRDYEIARDTLADGGCIVLHDANDRYDVNDAVTAARADGFLILPITTSCSPVVMTRHDMNRSPIDLALALGVRGCSVCRTLEGL